MSLEVYILDGASGEFVVASLVESVAAADLADAESQWSPARQALVERLRSRGFTEREIVERFQHSHWNWVAKVPYLMLRVQCVGIKVGTNGKAWPSWTRQRSLRHCLLIRTSRSFTWITSKPRLGT